MLRWATSVSPAWWKKITAPICSAAFQNGRNSGSSKVRPLTWSLISTPLRPSWVMQRSSSSIDDFTSCIGSVPSPAKRWGQPRDHASDLVVGLAGGGQRHSRCRAGSCRSRRRARRRGRPRRASPCRRCVPPASSGPAAAATAGGRRPAPPPRPAASFSRRSVCQSPPFSVARQKHCGVTWAWMSMLRMVSPFGSARPGEGGPHLVSEAAQAGQAARAVEQHVLGAGVAQRLQLGGDLVRACRTARRPRPPPACRRRTSCWRCSGRRGAGPGDPCAGARPAGSPAPWPAPRRWSPR